MCSCSSRIIQPVFSRKKVLYKMSQKKSTKIHQVPDFYCCYLLRSIPKKQSFYIGSTPNPIRRLRQHNGILNKGGAYRTKREGTRPWAMVLCVHGFPNKIAALQFEHAWQHSYQTRYIDADKRIVKSKTNGRSIHQKVGNLRLLLSHSYFEYMGLTVQFFDKDIFSTWEENRFKIGGEFNIQVSESDDLPTIAGTDSNELIINIAECNMKLVESLYLGLIAHDKSVYEYYQDRLCHGDLKCGICKQTFNYTSNDENMKPFIAFCPHKDCKFISHLGCLHRVFVDDEQLNGETHIRTLIPKSGTCPTCEQKVQWPTIIKHSTKIKALLGHD